MIAADDTMIKHAVRKHFEGIENESLVTSYFDKLIQIPIRVPPLGTQEVRAYMMLLFVENSALSKDDKEAIRRRSAANFSRPGAVNASIVHSSRLRMVSFRLNY